MTSRQIGSALESDILDKAYAYLKEHESIEGYSLDQAGAKVLFEDFEKHVNLIPCGFFRYEAEREGPQRFSYVSRSMLRLLGYSTYAEFEAKFDNSFINLVYEHDRERVMDEIYEQVARSGEDYCEYRVECADGHLMWVFDRGILTVDSAGREWFYVVIVDADKSKREQMRQAWQQEERIMLMHTPGTTTYNYDPAADRIELDICDKDGSMRSLAKENFVKGPDELDWLAPECREVFRQAWEHLLRTGDSGFYDVNTRLTTDDFEWHRVTYRSVKDIDGTIFRVVGRSDNINSYMEMVDDWKDRALHDPLTGLLNSSAFKHSLERTVKAGTPGSLFLLDIDKFKLVNDSYGHLYGDHVLKSLAKCMRSLFRGIDILGRFGGDEFQAFLPGLTNQSLLEQRIEALMQEVSEIGKAEGRHVFISVGAVIYDGGACAVKDLLRRADSALYESKAKGGHVCTIFHQD